ncbi:threonine--tRNA ligase [Halodesulfovibrio marinisediminis]|uniref:Threonine--tRNA ligase n=1 Tax=Halodesulfovibrio marinisediminis DSM 17456 TaxID=1121457 RepID=A0A1N6IRY3_9BACT|nr:threonine--tRNA ligase [Halodesulfovibrio marinisediminis]SIO34792.1 threonyl-tRNA synthetase [Halodesulfovibrio marinisediminis DSM 17456]
MNVSIEGQVVEVAADASCRDALREILSGKKLKTVLAAKCGTATLDLTATIPAGCEELTPVYADTPEGLDLLRHSTAHIMADAVKRLFPSAKVTIGPSIENGFYYDFDVERPFTTEDLEAIEAEMTKIIREAAPFTCEVVSKDEAKKMFADMGESYKLELIDAVDDDVVSIYRHGEFADLCRGPHLPTTGYVKAFKLMSVAGAYWRGDEKNPMLSRIYGTAFADPKALKKYLSRLEEAKKRDHRKLGAALDLFSFQEEGGVGMAYWHPKGALIRTILEDFERKEHLKRGYDIVQAPQILKRELWERSGHYDNYRENMYFTEIDEVPYGVKPMNCVAHMLIYKSHMRSYRDLPMRYFELGVVHRHEKSGVLHGLMRVRQFTQDDAHIICRPDQLQEEIVGVLNFVKDIMNVFGFEYSLELSTRPEKSIGDDADWDLATDSLIEALKAIDLPYEINEGDGAFYGPKIDIKLRDCLDREWQCATVQCDFTLPERFDLGYVGEDGERHRPVMVHRVILGSVERFIGILTEHYAGAFPTWLAPVQARVLTVTDAHNEFAEKIKAELLKEGIRVEADTRNEKLGYKVREAQVSKIPYMLVIGDKEVEEQGVNVRMRKGENLGLKSVSEVVELIKADCEEPFKSGGLSYRFS